MGWDDETRKLGSERQRARERKGERYGERSERRDEWEMVEQSFESSPLCKNPYMRGKTAGMFSGLMLIGGRA